MQNGKWCRSVKVLFRPLIDWPSARPFHFAKVGIAGSSPVIRSRRIAFGLFRSSFRSDVAGGVPKGPMRVARDRARSADRREGHWRGHRAG